MAPVLEIGQTGIFNDRMVTGLERGQTGLFKVRMATGLGVVQNWALQRSYGNWSRRSSNRVL